MSHIITDDNTYREGIVILS